MSSRLQLPNEVNDARNRAMRLQWISLATTAICVVLVFTVAGNSQAMKAAWIEDALSLIPPLAFIVANHVSVRAPSRRFPYGLHRSVGVGHLIASVALTSMGVILIAESSLALLTAEHPTIGTIEVLGVELWQGWLMIGVMALTGVPPVLLGRIKLRYARKLHDKILFADAEMNKADWQTAAGSIVGIVGIGIGLWWLDATAAILIASSILKDGLSNLRASLLDLMDKQARSYDDSRPHPILGRVRRVVEELPWVAQAACRARDQGHEFHIEVFVVLRPWRRITYRRLEEARTACVDLGWHVRDVVIVPVREIPPILVPSPPASQN